MSTYDEDLMELDVISEDINEQLLKLRIFLKEKEEQKNVYQTIKDDYERLIIEQQSLKSTYEFMDIENMELKKETEILRLKSAEYEKKINELETEICILNESKNSNVIDEVVETNDDIGIFEKYEKQNDMNFSGDSFEIQETEKNSETKDLEIDNSIEVDMSEKINCEVALTKQPEESIMEVSDIVEKVKESIEEVSSVGELNNKFVCKLDNKKLLKRNANLVSYSTKYDMDNDINRKLTKIELYYCDKCKRYYINQDKKVMLTGKKFYKKF